MLLLADCRLPAVGCNDGGNLRRHTSASSSNGGSGLTHIDAGSNNPTMVDVSDKRVTKRTAHARSVVRLPPEVMRCFERGDIASPKGPVFATAIVAGTMAAKKTSDLIPFCHPLGIESCKITITKAEPEDLQSHSEGKKKVEKDERGEHKVVVDCVVGVSHKTGVEMEALTGASVAALCIYDMCKALSHDIVIEETRLIKKTGGKSDLDYSSNKQQ